MLGNLARPVRGWGPGEIPGPTPRDFASVAIYGGRQDRCDFVLFLGREDDATANSRIKSDRMPTRTSEVDADLGC